MATPAQHALQPNGIYALLRTRKTVPPSWHWIIWIPDIELAADASIGHTLGITHETGDSPPPSPLRVASGSVIPGLMTEPPVSYPDSDETTWTYAGPEAPPVSLAEHPETVLLVQFGSLFDGLTIQFLDDILRQIHLESPLVDAGQPFGCRVWFREAVRQLDDHGIVHCRDVNKLEAEIRTQAIGATEAWVTSAGVSGYRIKVARTSR